MMNWLVSSRNDSLYNLTPLESLVVHKFFAIFDIFRGRGRGRGHGQRGLLGLEEAMLKVILCQK